MRSFAEACCYLVSKILAVLQRTGLNWTHWAQINPAHVKLRSCTASCEYFPGNALSQSSLCLSTNTNYHFKELCWQAFLCEARQHFKSQWVIDNLQSVSILVLHGTHWGGKRKNRAWPNSFSKFLPPTFCDGIDKSFISQSDLLPLHNTRVDSRCMLFCFDQRYLPWEEL